MILVAPRPSRRTFRALPILVAPIAFGCSGDPSGPGGSSGTRPGINIVAGANATDTIGAPLRQALSIVVRDADGNVIPNAVVRFSSEVVKRPDGYSAFSVLLGDLGAVDASSFLAETTSANGEAFARIVMGTVAGAGHIRIEVPQAGLDTTATFTITPGAATKVLLPVADTTVQVGRTLPLSGHVVDRFQNARADVVTYQVSGSGLTLTNGQVSASAAARAAVIGRFGALAPDTTWVSVVPAATIAAFHASKVVTVALDGSDLVQIPHTLETQGDGPEWHPDGQSLLALLGTFGEGRTLYRVELNGATQPVIDPSVPAVGYTYSAVYSPDARWVYLARGSCNYASILFRVGLSDPKTVWRVSPTGPDECFELVNHWPSLSPDGTRVAFENQTWNKSGYSVRVMDVGSGATTEIVPGGEHPRWSPKGDLIAYWADQQMWVVRPDGSGARVISPAGHTYAPGAQWSPDGQWVLARFLPRAGWAGTTVALINVTSGLEIPLAWTSGYGDFSLPAWRPTP
jgi:hypothetical protein